MPRHSRWQDHDPDEAHRTRTLGPVLFQPSLYVRMFRVKPERFAGEVDRRRYHVLGQYIMARYARETGHVVSRLSVTPIGMPADAFAVTFFVFDNVPPDWGCVCDLITDYWEVPQLPVLQPIVLGEDPPWNLPEEEDDRDEVEVEVVGGGTFRLPGQQRRPD